MTTRTSAVDRHAAARRVMNAIAVGPTPVELPYQAPDGSRPVVVTTPREYLSEVIKRMKVVGGSANIVLADVNTFTVFSMQSDDGHDDSDGTEDVTEEISMGMLNIRAKAKGSSTFRVHGGSANLIGDLQKFSYA